MNKTHRHRLTLGYRTAKADLESACRGDKDLYKRAFAYAMRTTKAGAHSGNATRNLKNATTLVRRGEFDSADCGWVD